MGVIKKCFTGSRFLREYETPGYSPLVKPFLPHAQPMDHWCDLDRSGYKYAAKHGLSGLGSRGWRTWPLQQRNQQQLLVLKAN
jgi:hypothetical protein